MRWDVRRHADGDAGRAVEQQIGDARWQHRRLDARVVVVRHHIDGVAVDVGEQLFRDRRHLGFGVAHGCGRVAIDTAKVPLPVHEQVAHREVLCEARHRLVHGGVAVGVILSHDFTHDRRALAVRGVRAQAHLVHREEDAALNRLQAVADVWQRALDDDGHRVVEIRRTHLIFDAPVADIAGAGVSGHAVE